MYAQLTHLFPILLTAHFTLLPLCSTGARQAEAAAPKLANVQAESTEGPNERKARILREIDERVRNSTAMLLGGKHVESLREELAAYPPQVPSMRIFQTREKIIEYLLFEGELEQALKETVQLERFAGERRLDGDYLVRALLKRAITHMRMAERANCFTHHNEESCIFPLSAKAIHSDKSGAQSAIQILDKILEMRPDHRQALWLLNVAHMAVGDYPAGVAPQFRIPPERFASEYDIGRFRNVAAEVGLATFNLAGGSIVDDFNRDGLLDVMTSSSRGDQSLSLHLNKGDGQFENATAASELAGQIGGLNLIHADYDNDGLLDVLVLRGAWMREWGEIPNSLLRQRPDGSFEDVTLKAGIEVSAPTQTACFLDVDLDGWLDLYIGYESQRNGPVTLYPNKLYRNKGDGTFEDKTAIAGVENWAYCKGVTAGDYDRDGDPDLYVANLDLPNRLYRNEGDWKFRDVALALGVHAPLHSFGTWFFDYNNDGWLDIWVNYYGQQRTEQVVGYYFNGAAGLDVSRLYENDGQGGFRDVTNARSLDRAHFTMGCSFGDLDNDGYSDVYLATGDPDLGSLWPNVILRNDRAQRFQDVTQAGGFGILQKGHGVSFADIDGDGDQDVLAQTGGAVRDDGFWNALFLNPGHGNHWVTLALEGVRSNRCAFGAEIRVRVRQGPDIRDIYATVGSVSSFGGNSHQQEIGLGQAQEILELEVYWPASKSLQHFEDVPLDHKIGIREGDAEFVILPLPSFKLGS